MKTKTELGRGEANVTTDMKRVTLWLPESVWHQLRTLSDDANTTRQELIRAILEGYVTNQLNKENEG